MDISEVVDNFKTTPFLFVGSGFSKRYYSLPSWRELLEYFARRVSNDEFSLSKYISKAKDLQTAQQTARYFLLLLS